MKYIWFFCVILLISTIYYVKADQLSNQKLTDLKNPTPIQILNTSQNSIATQNSTNNSTNIATQNSTNSAADNGQNSNFINPSSIFGTIEGQIFEDLNANGIRDLEQGGIAGSEVVLPGWQINLKGKDFTGNSVSLTTTTDEYGNYHFSGIAAGNYIISEVLPNGWQASSVSGYTVTIENGSDIFGKDFGNFHRGTIVGGIKIDGRNTIISIIKSTFVIIGGWKCTPNCQAIGYVKYQDNSSNLIINSIKLNTIATTADGRKGIVTGNANINGAGSYYFTIYMEDDLNENLFEISIPEYEGYSNRIIMDEGNIRLS